MRSAHHGVAAAALANNFMSSYSNNNSSPVRTKKGDVLKASIAEMITLPLVDNDDEDEEGGGLNSVDTVEKVNVDAAFLKRQTTTETAGENSGSVGSRNKPKRRSYDNTATVNDEDGKGTANGNTDTTENQNRQDLQPEKTPAQLRSIQKWHQECRQQELTHLEESNQNVQLLLQRRKRTRERSRHIERQINGRSDSPAGTATSASSSSSDEENIAAASSSAASASATKEKEDDPLSETLHALELAENHRGWYQRDGRLVVLESLPRMSLRGVVTHPVTSSSKSSSESMASSREDDDDDANRGIVTLDPGCAVMVESAFVLDSRTLRQLYPLPTPNIRSHSKCKPASTISNDPDTSSDESCPKLSFLKITSPHSGYILSNIHSYPLLLPGLPTTYTQTDHWLWRVTCQPDGAFIRRGLELVTDHLGTLPYGTVCEVKKKVVNGMGLNRLKIEARLQKMEAVGGVTDRVGANEASNDEADAFGMIKYCGYISEFLNPLSGQRGNVVEPIPFPVPALYKVVHAKGCIIRSGVELSTSQIGFAPPDAVLSIVGRSYSNHPGHNCLERLKLAGGGGWISLTLNRRPPGNDTLVEMVGVDGRFDPRDPASFHFESVKRVMEELHANDGGGEGNNGGNGRSYRRLSSYADLSEIGEDDSPVQLLQQQQQIPAASLSDNSHVSPAGSLGISPHNTAVPTLFRNGVSGGLSSTSSASCSPLGAMDAIRESSSDAHHPHDRGSNSNRCLICLSDERTATIVHGDTGHIASCLTCARILKARGDSCPVCRLPIDLVIQHFWA